MPVMGLIASPEGVTSVALDGWVGALKTPLLNKKPATFP